jgi:hypothetical protein
VVLPGAGGPGTDVVRGIRPDRIPGGADRAARAEITRRVGPAEHSVAQTAPDFGVSWHAAMAAVRDHGRPGVDHLARPGAPAAGSPLEPRRVGVPGRVPPMRGHRLQATPLMQATNQSG